MRAALVLAAVALVAALLAAAVLTFVNTYSGQDCEVTAAGSVDCASVSRTIIEENGRWVYGLFAVPIALAAGVLIAAAYRLPNRIEWLLAFASLAACIIAILSIGAFFLPSALLLVAASASDRRGSPQP